MSDQMDGGVRFLSFDRGACEGIYAVDLIGGRRMFVTLGPVDPDVGRGRPVDAGELEVIDWMVEADEPIEPRALEALYFNATARERTMAGDLARRLNAEVVG
jgi:hypothetical protein